MTELEESIGFIEKRSKQQVEELQQKIDLQATEIKELEQAKLTLPTLPDDESTDVKEQQLNLENQLE